MDDFALPAELLNGSQKPQVLVIIEQQVLARTCILSILKRELTGFEIVEMATTSGLNWLSGRDVRLIALNIGNKDITDPSIEDDLALLAEFCPNASVALLSNRDDEATSTDHYRALDKTKPRTQRRYRQTPALPSYPQSTSLTAPPGWCPKRP